MLVTIPKNVENLLPMLVTFFERALEIVLYIYFYTN